MSATPSAKTWPRIAKGIGAFLRPSGDVWELVARYLVHQAAVARLRECDDRSLREIGLARSQIEAAVRSSVAAGRSGV
jgi:uncharacterized protein YjiS (DUF1127 family)